MSLHTLGILHSAYHAVNISHRWGLSNRMLKNPFDRSHRGMYIGAIMIELNKVRTMKALEAIQKPLRECVTFDRATMVSVYAEDFGWGEDDYEADKEQAEYLLEQVNHRMKSLAHHLAKDKNAFQSPVPPAVMEPDAPVV